MHFFFQFWKVDNFPAYKHIIFIFTGGWHVLRNFNYDDFDYNHVLKQLHVKYGVSPYFKITVEPNPGSPGSSSIRISPSGLGLPDRRYYYTLQDDPVSIFVIL